MHRPLLPPPLLPLPHDPAPSSCDLFRFHVADSEKAVLYLNYALWLEAAFIHSKQAEAWSALRRRILISLHVLPVFAVLLCYAPPWDLCILSLSETNTEFLFPHYEAFFFFFKLLFYIGEGNGTPHQYSCLETPMDRGAGRLQSMELLRVRHDWATSLSLFSFMHWRRKWQPAPVFLPGES